MASPVWDPAQYARFADQRMRPARDLIARIPLDAPGIVFDLGCGPGNVTALLAARWPGTRIVGIDNSPAMIARARRTSAAVDWREADIAGWRSPRPADLIFANASLQWLDDHAALFARLIGALAPEGVIAVQMPRNFDAPSHRCMTETIESGPWRERLARARPDWPVATPEAYYAMLAPHARRLDIWETVYLHALEGDNPVVEWTRGTGLKPFLDALDDEDERAAFLADYAARIARAYPRRSDGRTLLPFRRLFIVAVRR
ncbi:MAG: trans-aconitate 2-methyltransferase [Alphaproteobacteria bacterium]